MGFAAALVYALLMNGIPLAAVIYTGGSPAVLLLLYWFETVMMVVTGAIRIVVHRRATGRAGHYVAAATASHKDATAPSVRRALGGVAAKSSSVRRLPRARSVSTMSCATGPV